MTRAPKTAKRPRYDWLVIRDGLVASRHFTCLVAVKAAKKDGAVITYFDHAFKYIDTRDLRVGEKPYIVSFGAAMAPNA